MNHTLIATMAAFMGIGPATQQMAQDAAYCGALSKVVAAAPTFTAIMGAQASTNSRRATVMIPDSLVDSCRVYLDAESNWYTCSADEAIDEDGGRLARGIYESMRDSVASCLTDWARQDLPDRTRWVKGNVVVWVDDGGPTGSRKGYNPAIRVRGIAGPPVSSASSPAPSAVPQPRAATMPADEPYAPTKLEWAILELSAQLNLDEIRATGVRVSFTGRKGTLIAVIRYPKDYSAQALTELRRYLQDGVGVYKMIRGWDWLQLEFDEAVK